MDTKKQLTLAWTVAGILAVLLVIALFFLMGERNDLGSVLEEGREDITAQRDEIREACNSTDEASRARCNESLEELADILREFSLEIERATSTAPVAE